MMTDLKLAVRQLAKAPGFTFVAVFTLALGIGACTAMFSVVNSVLLRPIEYPESERIVIIRESFPPEYPVFSVAPANLRDWQAQSTKFESMYAQRNGSYNLTGRGEPLRVLSQRATGGYFATLRAQPLLGRVFGPAEDTPETGHVVVLAHGFWQRQFGGRSDVLGGTLQLNGVAHTIIGVMPPGFQRGYPFEVFAPMALTEREWQERGGHDIFVGGRLKPGVTVGEARAELVTIAARLAQQYPDTNKGWTVVVNSILENNTAPIRDTLYTLLAAVGVLLLIACANVANLLLARATARQREMSVRAALGASRWRIARQLFTENLALAGCGGVLGVLVGKWALDALLLIAPANLPRAAEISLDGRALAATLVATLLTGLGFGLVPVLQASRVDLVGALREGARGAGGSGRRHFVRHALVVVEIALAAVLLTGAGLLVRSFTKLAAFQPGFEPQGALMVNVAIPGKKYPTPESQAAFAQAVIERFRTVPGVSSVGATHVMPMAGSDYVLSLEIEGRDVPPSEQPNTNYYAVTPDYFQAAGIPLRRGRAFTDQDRAGANPVAIISQSLADRHFPGLDPLGRRIFATNGPRTWHEIVGVVGDVKHYGVEHETAPQTYTPLAQTPFNFFSFVVRASVAPLTLAPALRREVQAVDPEQPVSRIEPLEHLLTVAMARQRFAMTLFTVFSGLALVLAAVGIYGVMAYAVSQRTGEFGIRLALGAQPSDILSLVLGQGLRLISVGLAGGVIGGLAAGKFLQSLLFQTPAHDPVVFGAISLLLAIIATLACLIPARRATKVDPMVALRAE